MLEFGIALIIGEKDDHVRFLVRLGDADYREQSEGICLEYVTESRAIVQFSRVNFFA